MLTWSLLLAGCRWIGFAEHRENLEALTQGDADTDADSDSDSDSDTDTDTAPTGDTGLPGCRDDAQEPNDFAAEAFVVVPPDDLQGRLCPGDLGLDGAPVPTDAYRVDVGPDETLRVRVQSGADTACDDQTFKVDLSLDGEIVSRGSGKCPTLLGGEGEGTYVLELRDQGQTEQDYALSFSKVACHDGDRDGALDAGCFGPDCDDGDDQVGPAIDEVGALASDDLDQDCDGRDDLDGQACAPTLTGTPMGGDGTLPCGDPYTDPVWDAWQLPASPQGVTISLGVQNGAGGADLMAYLRDPSGSHYGFEPDGSQLDDELFCPHVVWNDGACPGACWTVRALGRGELWVAQRPGAGCVDGASYRIIVQVDGGNQFSVEDQVADDAIFAPTP